MDKFVEWFLYILMAIAIGLLILWLAGTAFMVIDSHRLACFMRDNQYGVVVGKYIQPNMRMVKQGFAPSAHFELEIKGLTSCDVRYVRVMRQQYNEVELADTILFDSLFL